MRLIEYERVSPRKNLAEAFLFDRQVGEQQMMVHHDEIGFLRRASRLDHEAIAKLWALRAKAIFGGRGNARPQRRLLHNLGEFAAIPAARALAPLAYRLQLRDLLTRCQTTVLGCLLEAMQTQIVGAALEQARAQARAKHLAYARQIAVKQLILQCLRAGRHDHAL